MYDGYCGSCFGGGDIGILGLRYRGILNNWTLYHVVRAAIFGKVWDLFFPPRPLGEAEPITFCCAFRFFNWRREFWTTLPRHTAQFFEWSSAVQWGFKAPLN